MKRAIIGVLLISMLLASSAVVFVHAEDKNAEKTQKGIGKVHIDASPILKEFAYTEENMSNVPLKLLIQLTRAYRIHPTLLPNGDYYVKITSNSTEKITEPENPQYILPSVESDIADSGGSTESLIQGKACLVVAIWDYPGELADLDDLERSYNVILDHLSGRYTYWHTLVNSAATRYYVWAWLTWECLTYQNVDVYFLGHGTQIEFWPYTLESAYLCYDGWDDYWGVLLGGLYTQYDFTSYYFGNYDYSPLRVGVGGFCYGYGFNSVFLNPGGSVSHYRAYTGPEGVSNTYYSYDFQVYWNYWWYTMHYSSYESYCFARDQAVDQLLVGETPYSYVETGSIWF